MMIRDTTDRSAVARARIESFFSREVEEFKRSLRQLDAEIAPECVPTNGDAIHRRVLEAFQASQEACGRFESEFAEDREIVDAVQRRFRLETALWFDRSWIANRSRTKPSGFAGDYEMLNVLYNQSTPARGLGGYLDLCILDLPLARAVRSRLQSVRRFLLNELRDNPATMRVLDIACGPCREFLNWPSVQGGSVEIVAMDSDPAALQFIADHVVPALPVGLTLAATRYNALRTRSAETTVEKFGRFDVIYSVGLCDYLPDNQLVELLAGWGATLNKGGVLYVAFKDTEQYDKTPYQWHLDWFFFQRTSEDCLRLYKEAGFDLNTMEVTRDSTGIIIHFVNRLKSDELKPHFAVRRSRRNRTSAADIPS